MYDEGLVDDKRNTFAISTDPETLSIIIFCRDLTPLALVIFRLNSMFAPGQKKKETVIIDHLSSHCSSISFEQKDSFEHQANHTFLRFRSHLR